MATWREWLNKAGFDWESGVLILQEPEIPDWLKDIYEDPEPFNLVRWHNAKIETAASLTRTSEILDREFQDHGFPLIFAKDKDAIYMIHWAFCGAGLERISTNPQEYLDKISVVTPLGGD